MWFSLHLCLQSQREVTLAGFRSGKFPVLVATDVAARGLDISCVELVVQCEPPKDPETYIHRSGTAQINCVIFVSSSTLTCTSSYLLLLLLLLVLLATLLLIACSLMPCATDADMMLVLVCL